MRWLLDLLFLLAAVLTAPWWLTRMVRTGKINTDWRGKFGGVTIAPADGTPRLLLHAVSVGEVNAIRLLVDQLAASQTIDLVIATTTDTGFARAKALFGERHSVVRYPLDFSFAVRRFLKAVEPNAVALVELEVWPNFAAACKRRAIPLCVINGRLTQRSYARYRLVRPFMRRAFRSLCFAAVQNDAYAERFLGMGVDPEALLVTGTMKWDTAEIADDVPGAIELAEDLKLDPEQPLIVAGSTAPGEHELLVEAIPEGVQLLCAPRRPEWFDLAASAMPGCVRRSRYENRRSETGRYLLDTIGELRLAYALADIVVVGRSFGNLHGSDMMEPIALGKPTIVGPAVADFLETTDALLAGEGIVQTDPTKLADIIRELLHNANLRDRLSSNGRAVIRQHQGATQRHADLLSELMHLTVETDATTPSQRSSEISSPEGAQRVQKRNSPFQREAETAKEKKEERTC